MGGAGLRQERSYLTRDSASVCWHFPSNAAPPSSGIWTAIYSPPNSRDSKFWLRCSSILAHFQGSLVMISQIILSGLEINSSFIPFLCCCLLEFTFRKVSQFMMSPRALTHLQRWRQHTSPMSSSSNPSFFPILNMTSS